MSCGSIASHANSTGYARGFDRTQSIRALTEASIINRAAGNLWLALISMNFLAEQYLYRGQLHKAKSVHEQAISIITEEKAQELPVAGLALIGISEILREQNELVLALQFVSEGYELISTWGNVKFLVDSQITLARIRQAQGDIFTSLSILKMQRTWLSNQESKG